MARSHRPKSWGPFYWGMSTPSAAQVLYLECECECEVFFDLCSFFSVESSGCLIRNWFMQMRLWKKKKKKNVARDNLCVCLKGATNMISQCVCLWCRSFFYPIFLKTTTPLRFLCFYCGIASLTVAQFYSVSLPVETSDMVTQFISGSTELDIETFIRVPGFSPLLMNYSLTLNSLRFSPEIARWECEVSLEEAHYNERAISLHCVRKAKL